MKIHSLTDELQPLKRRSQLIWRQGIHLNPLVSTRVPGNER